MSNKPRKKSHSPITRKNRLYRQMAKGVNVYWHTADPLGNHTTEDIFDHKMFHTNALYSQILKEKDPYFLEVILEQVHNWEVHLDMICHDGTNEYVKGVVVSFTNKFGNLQDCMEEQIEELLSKANLKHYKKFKIHGKIK